MSTSSCPEFTRLENEVTKILDKLREITTVQLEVFRSRNYEAFARVDKEIELTVGKKERMIGAFRQHATEHKCAPGLKI